MSLWYTFRKFRKFTLSSTAVLCLIWTIIITVYLARNWGGYDGAQRGYLAAFAVLQFFSAILVYLMSVVQYRYWPDAARTAFLVGLHLAATIVFTLDGLQFPCNAFGSASDCRRMTWAVLVGSWIISALLIAYAAWLPFMAFIPPPPAGFNGDVENGDADGSGESNKSLQKNGQGESSSASGHLESPIHPGRLPRQPSLVSSLSPSLNQHQPMQTDDRMTVGYDVGSMTGRSESVYSVTTPRSGAFTISPSSDHFSADSMAQDPSSGPFAPYPSSRSEGHEQLHVPNRFRERSAVHRANSAQSSTTVDSSRTTIHDRTSALVDGDGMLSQRSSTVDGSYSYMTYPPSDVQRALSATSRMPGYSQKFVSSSRPFLGSPLAIGSRPGTPETPSAESTHSMKASVHDHSQSRPVPGSSLQNVAYAQPTFEPHLVETGRRRGVDPATLVSIAESTRGSVYDQRSLRMSGMDIDRRRSGHERSGSTSTVDINEWKKLVLNAAGKNTSTS